MNNILNNINIFKNYTQHEVIDPNISLDELIVKINNKKNWNIKDSKTMLDILYEIEKNEYKNKKKLSQDEINKIDFYKSYIQHQIDFIKHLQNHILNSKKHNNRYVEYECKACSYSTKIKNSYTRHLTSQKHKRL